MSEEAKAEAVLQEAIKAAAIGGANGRLLRVVVFLRSRHGQRVDARLVAEMVRAVKRPATERELAECRELEAIMEAEDRAGMAEA